MEYEVKEPSPKYRYVSPDEYLEMEQVTDERLEYYNGQGTPSRQNYMYADALIYFGKHILEVSKYDTIINPSVILEIQSPCMGGLNKKRKLHFYKEIPTLKEYIIIDSQKCNVEVARKQSDGDWATNEIYDRDGFIFIETIGYELTLPEIYKDTGL